MKKLKEIPNEKIAGILKVLNREIYLKENDAVVTLFKEYFGDIIMVPDNCQMINIEGNVSEGRLSVHLRVWITDKEIKDCNYIIIVKSEKSQIFQKTADFLKAISLFIP